MNYTEGCTHMITLCKVLAINTSSSFIVGKLRIDYPGYKKLGDYRLSFNGIAPKHTDVVDLIYNMTLNNNFNDLVNALDDLYNNGLHSSNVIFSQNQKELIFWITLQEEINYPQPRYSGRKLPYQRYYEAMLAKMGVISLSDVKNRTNNHGRIRPVLYSNFTFKLPSFYL